MKCQVKSEPRLSETRIHLASDSYVDSMPILRELIFRRGAPKLSAQAFPLALAVLLSEHIGETFETHIAVAGDYLEAIHVLCGRPVNVMPLNAGIRALATHELTIVCGEAGPDGQPAYRPPAGEAVPVLRLDWFGDFVSATTRSSEGCAVGVWFTNAHLVAPPEFVSVAVALIHGGDHVGRIVVPVAGPLSERHMRCTEALRVVAVELEWLTSPVPSIAETTPVKARRRPVAVA